MFKVWFITRVFCQGPSYFTIPQPIHSVRPTQIQALNPEPNTSRDSETRVHQTEAPSARSLVFDLFILRLICPKETCVPLSEWQPASRDSVLCSREFTTIKWNVTLCEIIRVASMKLCCLFLVDARLCVVGRDRHAGWRPPSLNVAFLIGETPEFLSVW